MKQINIVAALKHQSNYQDADFIGVDRGCQYLLEQNIKFKKAIGDFDSIDKNMYQTLVDNNVEIIKLNPVKDETDLEYTIKYVYDNYDIINVYGAIGQRIDHTLTNINILKKYPKIIFYDDFSKIFILKKGEYNLEDINYNYISFFSIKNGTIISLINFKYPLKDYELSLDDTLCISNELNENSIVETNKDIIVVLSR